jgi:hypothetical protein
MKSKERVKKAFHFEKPDRVPIAVVGIKYDFLYCPVVEPRSWQPKKCPPHVQGGVNTISKSYYRNFIYDWNDKNREEAGFSKGWWKYPHDSIDDWGIIWKSAGTEGDDLTKGHPFKGPFQENWDDFDDYQIPDASDPKYYRLIKTKLWKFLGRKKYTLGNIGKNGFFNLCTQLRGFSNLLVDLARNPKQINQLIEKVLPFYLTQIVKFKEFYPNLDSIMIADDMGTQLSPFISPRLFKSIFKEPYKQIIKLTHDLGMDFLLHSCGQIYQLMPEIIDMGVDAFQLDSPLMTGVDNFKKFAEERKVAFWLSSNIQSTYILGTSEDVEEEIKGYIRDVGNNEGGLAICEYSSNKTIGTPRENIIAQREATLKWGNYSKNGVIDWIDD